MQGDSAVSKATVLNVRVFGHFHMFCSFKENWILFQPFQKQYIDQTMCFKWDGFQILMGLYAQI